MTTSTERKLETRGNFNEVFWDYSKLPKLCGIFTGFVVKNIDKEDRRFAVVVVEGEPKPFLCGGADLLNKLTDADNGRYVEIAFSGKDTFTPKGTKKKVPINRFTVAVEQK